MSPLVTRHDPFHVHKTLGLLVLLHFIYRYALLFSCGTAFPATESLSAQTAGVLLHGVLTWSSLLLRLPAKRNFASPMIWPVFLPRFCLRTRMDRPLGRLLDAVACDLLLMLACATLMTSSQSKARVPAALDRVYNTACHRHATHPARHLVRTENRRNRRGEREKRERWGVWRGGGGGRCGAGLPNRAAVHQVGGSCTAGWSVHLLLTRTAPAIGDVIAAAGRGTSGQRRLQRWCWR